MIRLSIIAGTRPEIIKLMPVYFAAKQHDEVDVQLIFTGQHQEMAQQIFDYFDFVPDHNLRIMTSNQSLSGLTAQLFTKIDEVIAEQRPDVILVQGDTTTAFVGAMVAFYHRIKVGHVEAGLRTEDKWNPFPEEVNRKLIGTAADFHFTPTRQSTKNLEKEGATGIFEVGNTVVDSLKLGLSKVEETRSTYLEHFESLLQKSKTVLITGHRRESFGEGFKEICAALKTLAGQYQDVNWIYPVHLNPNVRETVHHYLGGIEDFHLIDPVPYDQMVFLMSQAHLILTDSGGIQEEAPTLGVPTLVMRKVTERMEGITAGCSMLVGTTQKSIVEGFNRIYKKDSIREQMVSVGNPFGDGLASKRIIQILVDSIA